MVDVVANAAEFFNVPEGASTVLDKMSKNEDNQFEMEISEKVQLSPDTYRFTFKFADPEWLMGLPLAKHMIFFKPPQAEGEEPVARKYTPVSPMT